MSPSSSSLFCLVFVCVACVVRSCPDGFYGPTCDVPKKCAYPEGLDCSFYLDCLNSFKQCDITEKVCDVKCREYEQLEPSLSSDGQQWSKYVRKCLQDVMSDHLLLKLGSNYQCSDIENSFFNDHVPCYVDGPVSFCDLPLSDNIKVMWRAKDIFWKGYLSQATAAGFTLLSKCGMKSFQPEDDMFDPFKSVNGQPSLWTVEELEQELQIIGEQEYPDWEFGLVKIDNKRQVVLAKPTKGSETELTRSQLSEITAKAVQKVNSKHVNVATLDVPTGFLVGGVVVCATIGTVVGLFAMKKYRSTTPINVPAFSSQVPAP